MESRQNELFYPTRKMHYSKKGIVIAAASGFLVIAGVISPVFSLIALAITAIYICFASPEDAYYQMFFLVPFAAVFKMNAEGTSFFTYLCLILIIRFFLLERKINTNFLLSWIFFAIYVFVGCSNNITVLIKQIIIPLLLYCFFTMCKPNLKRLILYFTFGLLLSSTIALFIDVIPNMSNYIVVDRAWELEDIYRFSGLYSDPNYYSFALILASTVILILFVCKQMHYEAFVLLAAIIVFGVKTVSKSFFLMLVIIAVVFFVLLLKQKKYVFSIIYFTLLAIVAFMVFTGKIHIFDNIFVRLGVAEDITTGRSDIWDGYISYFSNNIFRVFFGAGAGAGYFQSHVAHNTYIDFIYYYGILGSGLFIYTCRCACIGYAHRKKTLANYFTVFIVIIAFAFLSCLMYFDFAFVLILSLYVYKIDFKKMYGIRSKISKRNNIKTLHE